MQMTRPTWHCPVLTFAYVNVIIRKFNIGTLKFAELEKLLKSCAPDYV